MVWGRHPIAAADAAAGQHGLIGLAAAVVAVGLVAAFLAVAVRLRRTRRLRDGGEAALPPPPFPEAGIDRPITAPGRVQRPEVDGDRPGAGGEDDPAPESVAAG